jgi:hypothetical protein
LSCEPLPDLGRASLANEKAERSPHVSKSRLHSGVNWPEITSNMASLDDYGKLTPAAAEP